MADSPKTSDYTSIQQRIEAAKKDNTPNNLLRFQGSAKQNQQHAMPCSLKDYIELVNTTGRIIRDDKRGAIAASQSPILKRLKIGTDIWLHIATNIEKSSGPWVGSPERLRQACSNTGKSWACRTVACKKLYPT